MITKLIQFLANRYNLLALGDLRKVRIGKAITNLRLNGVLQFHRYQKTSQRDRNMLTLNAEN